MNSSVVLALVGILVTAVGSIASVAGLTFVWGQLRAGRRIAQGEFILRLSETLNAHEQTSRVLIDPAWKPNDEDNITKVEMVRYMEVFDQMKVLIDYQMIEPEVFQRLFGYRLYFIVMNDYTYREHLLDGAQWWPDTIALCKLMAT